MAHIAGSPNGNAVTASELAEATHVPVHYLSKVLRKLVTAGLLLSQKGHRGGFVLARTAREIRFMDVLEAVDRAPDRKRCAFGWGKCDSRNPCPLHPAWDKLGGVFLDWTQQTTLADLVPARAQRR
jgi:Rrf2 family protein